MTAVIVTAFQPFLADFAKGKTSAHDFSVDPFSIYLSNTTPNYATMAVKGDMPEIAIKNGYLGMVDLVATSRAIDPATGQWRIIVNDPPTWVGNTNTDGTGFGPFRYVVLINKATSGTDAQRKLIAAWTYASTITVTSGNAFKVDFNQTSGAIIFRGASA